MEKSSASALVSTSLLKQKGRIAEFLSESFANDSFCSVEGGFS